jgi:hypothetical protein
MSAALSWLAALPLALAPGAQERPRAERERVDLEAVVRDAVRWLVENQAPDGSWGSHHTARPIEVLASVPGSQEAFRVGTTALCVTALQGCPQAGEAGERAAERGVEYLLEHAAVKRQSGLEHYNVWSFGYALEALGERLGARPEDPRAREMRRVCATLIEKAALYQTTDGGWGYLSITGVPTFKPSDTSMSFTTATMLVGLGDARDAGVQVPADVIERALVNLRRSRLPDGAFLYGDYLQYRPRHGINERPGSACRGPLCTMAMQAWGEELEPGSLLRALEDLLVHHAALQRAALRRPIPHESWFAISGYFYLYGHAYAARALASLPEKEQARLWPRLAQAVLVCREPDGSFWDYPLYSYHKPYGTAFALIALQRVPPATVVRAPELSR